LKCLIRFFQLLSSVKNNILLIFSWDCYLHETLCYGLCQTNKTKEKGNIMLECYQRSLPLLQHLYRIHGNLTFEVPHRERLMKQYFPLWCNISEKYLPQRNNNGVLRCIQLNDFWPLYSAITNETYFLMSIWLSGQRWYFHRFPCTIWRLYSIL
jgi:hypothetical protein